MKALIIEDNMGKSAEILALVEDRAKGRSEIVVKAAATMSEAARLINTAKFDVVFLDLMIPFIEGGQPEARAGLELLKLLRRSDCINRLARVVAISAHPDEALSARQYFDEYAVSIVPFDETDLWKKAAGAIIEEVYYGQSKQVAVDCIIICALEEERRAFVDIGCESTSLTTIGGLNCQFVKLPGDGDVAGVIIRLSQMGLVSATYQTAQALKFFETSIVVMSGICAGFEGQVHLGDVVVASPAWEYQSGKWAQNGFQIAPLQVSLRPATRAVIERLFDDLAFGGQMEQAAMRAASRPASRISGTLAPCASGSAVIADKAKLEHITRQHRKIAALDMETYGVYYACYESATHIEHYFSAKSVVDFADASKGDELHAFGSQVAAKASVEIIRALLKTVL